MDGDSAKANGVARNKMTIAHAMYRHFFLIVTALDTSSCQNLTNAITSTPSSSRIRK
jgi:hypothetical protein